MVEGTMPWNPGPATYSLSTVREGEWKFAQIHVRFVDLEKTFDLGGASLQAIQSPCKQIKSFVHIVDTVSQIRFQWEWTLLPFVTDYVYNIHGQSGGGPVWWP